MVAQTVLLIFLILQTNITSQIWPTWHKRKIGCKKVINRMWKIRFYKPYFSGRLAGLATWHEHAEQSEHDELHFMLRTACRHLCQVDISSTQLQQPSNERRQQCIKCRFVLLSSAVQLQCQWQHQLTIYKCVSHSHDNRIIKPPLVTARAALRIDAVQLGVYLSVAKMRI